MMWNKFMEKVWEPYGPLLSGVILAIFFVIGALLLGGPDNSFWSFIWMYIGVPIALGLGIHGQFFKKKK